jgi:hypothetical protein
VAVAVWKIPIERASREAAAMKQSIAKNLRMKSFPARPVKYSDNLLVGAAREPPSLRRGHAEENGALFEDFSRHEDMKT